MTSTFTYFTKHKYFSPITERDIKSFHWHSWVLWNHKKMFFFLSQFSIQSYQAMVKNGKIEPLPLPVYELHICFLDLMFVSKQFRMAIFNIIVLNLTLYWANNSWEGYFVCPSQQIYFIKKLWSLSRLANSPQEIHFNAKFETRYLIRLTVFDVFFEKI